MRRAGDLLSGVSMNALAGQHSRKAPLFFRVGLTFSIILTRIIIYYFT